MDTEQNTDAEKPVSVESWATVARRHGFSVFVAMILLWSVIIGPNSTAAMALAVDAAATKITAQIKESGLLSSEAIRHEIGRIDTAGSSRADAAVRQLQADIGKVREDTQRMREALTLIQVELERARKQ